MALQAIQNPVDTPMIAGILNGQLVNNQIEAFKAGFSTMVLTWYEPHKVFTSFFPTTDISGHKSMSFPIIGKASAEYHIPGNEILSNTIKSSQRTITIDDVLFSASSLYKPHRQLDYINRIPHLLKSMTSAMLELDEFNVARTLVKAALTINKDVAAHTIHDYKTFDDEVFTENVEFAVANDEKVFDNWVSVVGNAQRIFVSKGISSQLSRPVLFIDDTYNDTLLNPKNAGRSLASKDHGGMGSIATGEMGTLLGCQIVPTHRLKSELLWDATSGLSKSARPNVAASGVGRQTAYDIYKTNVGTYNLLAASKKLVAVLATTAAVRTAQVGMGFSTDYIDDTASLSEKFILTSFKGHNIMETAGAIAILKK